MENTTNETPFMARDYLVLCAEELAETADMDFSEDDILDCPAKYRAVPGKIRRLALKVKRLTDEIAALKSSL